LKNLAGKSAHRGLLSEMRDLMSETLAAEGDALLRYYRAERFCA